MRSILKYIFYTLIILISAGIIYSVLICKISNTTDTQTIIVSDKSRTLFPPSDIISENKSLQGGIFFCPNFFEKTPDNPDFNQDFSHDGKLVVKIEKTGLVVKHLDSGKIIRKINNNTSVDPTKNLTGFYKPRFSPDDSKVYFMTDAWTTSTAIHELEINTGKTRFITDGYDLIVIPLILEKDIGGLVKLENYTGYLIAKQHKYFAGSGSYDWYWIINPKTGKNVEEPIGDNPWDFFDVWVCPSRESRPQ